MTENIDLVQKGFRILLPALGHYIVTELISTYNERWWDEVLSVLSDQSKDIAPIGSATHERLESLDVANLLRLFDRMWGAVFKKKLSIDYRTWSKELMGVRNRVAHAGAKDFSDSDTWRALDTMARLCGGFDVEAAEKINALLRQSRYGSAMGSRVVSTQLASEPVESASAALARGALPSWRSIVEPHKDVYEGLYKNAEFAADLAQVARGEGSFEYRDPTEFFARTYITHGMKRLLVQSLKRVLGHEGGDPVIQLKTAFGGGKTHSMLALYHLMRGRLSPDLVPAVRDLLNEVGTVSIPTVNVAVLVGTALNPAQTKRPPHMQGISINTIWGEMAAQLTFSAGNLALYDIVKEADKKGVSPGSTALKALFDACGPCLVLMDELVAYGKKLQGKDNLPAGTLDNFITFIQEVTEAARASKNSLVVASIPESAIEIGGQAGQDVLAAIEHTFGRMEAVWKPVAASEGFEVVQRRLFLHCKNPAAREAVCERFSQMYLENPGAFPIEARSPDYKTRMLKCFPIHPEIFDRLYEDWGTLERFQRTRGVLRLMAAVIHELWMEGDANPMILPGSLPLAKSSVRDELLRYLPETWNSIADHEIDGSNSLPYAQDKENPLFGKYSASRKVTRTIMLGSAPASGENHRQLGIELPRIQLGSIIPGDAVPQFKDALYKLRGTLSYLYSNDTLDRFWFDTKPTLTKTERDREAQIKLDDINHEIESLLQKTVRNEPPFGGVHCCPASSADVPDEQKVRLVILGTKFSHRGGIPDSTAIRRATELLHNRGAAQRIYRNMLVFLAADGSSLNDLQSGFRTLKAWRSILDDKDVLNLDSIQEKQVQQSIQRSQETVSLRLKEAFRWLLIPKIDPTVNLRDINWDISRISSSSDSQVTNVRRALEEQGALVSDRFAPLMLKRSLDQYLWKTGDVPHISISDLWKAFSSYCYFPRLANIAVLRNCITNGVNRPAQFGIATSFAGGRYEGLRKDEYISGVEDTDVLVHLDIATKQIENDIKANDLPPTPSSTPEDNSPHVIPQPSSDTLSHAHTQTTQTSGKKRFFLSKSLDRRRIIRDAQCIVEEIIQHLASIDSSELDVTIEVNFKSPRDIDQKKIRTVTENCKSLGVTEYGFEEE